MIFAKRKDKYALIVSAISDIHTMSKSIPVTLHKKSDGDACKIIN
jgi:hypothetical protein